MQKMTLFPAWLVFNCFLCSCAGYRLFYGDEKLCLSDSPTDASVKMFTMANGSDSKLMLEFTDAQHTKHRFFDYADRWPKSCKVFSLDDGNRFLIRVEDGLTRPLEVTFSLDSKRFELK